MSVQYRMLHKVVVLDLKDQLRSSGESTESQVTEMRHTIEGMRSHHEYEKKTLRDALNKVSLWDGPKQLYTFIQF